MEPTTIVVGLLALSALTILVLLGIETFHHLAWMRRQRRRESFQSDHSLGHERLGLTDAKRARRR